VVIDSGRCSTRGCASPGGQPASDGRITKAGPAHARGMLVEAAWSASKAAGPLRAFYQRVQARRGMQVAVVATARKLAVLCWHLINKGEDDAYAQPSLVAHKRRKLELRAGACGCREPCHVMRQCMYSCMRPPSRSRRSGRMVGPEGEGVRPVGGSCRSDRCRRCVVVLDKFAQHCGEVAGSSDQE